MSDDDEIYVVRQSRSPFPVLSAISHAAHKPKKKVPFRDVGSFAFVLDRVERRKLTHLGCDVTKLTPEMTTPDDFDFIVNEFDDDD